jgi:hypothetical protein
MSDNSISKRVYNRDGNVMKQEQLPMADIGCAIVKLENLLSDCKKNKYV